MKQPASQMVYGSVPALLWKRIAAFIIDLLILDLTVLSPFKNVLLRAMPVTDFTSFSAMLDSSAKLSGSLVFTLISMSIVAILYFALCESILGQTIGKMLFRLRVSGVTAPAGFWRCFIRSLFLLPIFPFVMFWFIDPLYMFFTRSSQRLLERWSNTATIESAPFAFKVSKVA